MADNDEIERVVRDVMARLSGAARTEPARLPQAEQSPAIRSTELMISAPVVTLEEIRNRLEGVRSIVVFGRAVVTPAVRDFLREQRIELSFAAKAAKDGAASTGKTAARLVVGVADTTYEPAGLIRAIGQVGIVTERLAKTGLVSIVDEMSDHVTRGGAMGLLLTHRIASGLCLANRKRGVRAVSGTSISCVAKAKEAVGANLLIIDPQAHPQWELQRITAGFCQSGPRPCPPELAAQLA